MATEKGLTIGFIGSGEVEADTIASLVGDFVEANGGAENVTFIIPLTEDFFTDAVKAVAEFASEQDIAYEVVIDDSTEKKRGLKGYLSGAQAQHKVARVGNKVVSLLEKAASAKLFVAYNEEDTEAGKVLEKAIEKEIEALDLTQGLYKLEFDDPNASGDDDEPKDGDGGGEDDDVLDEAEMRGDMPFPALKTLAKEYGVETPRGKKRDDIVDEILAEAERRAEAGGGSSETNGHAVAGTSELRVAEAVDITPIADALNRLASAVEHLPASLADVIVTTLAEEETNNGKASAAAEKPPSTGARRIRRS